MLNYYKNRCCTRQVLDQLYDSLNYSTNLKFSMEVCESIYERAKLEKEEFVNQYSVQYYNNKRNILAVESIDKSLRFFSNKYHQLDGNYRSGAPQYLCSLVGNVLRVGTTICTDILIFTPLKTESLEGKLMKRNKIDVKDSSHHIIEGDTLLLTSFFTPSYQVPFMSQSTSNLAKYLNEACKQERAQNKQFVDSITEYGNLIEYALIATVKEIFLNNKLKLAYNPNSKEG